MRHILVTSVLVLLEVIWCQSDASAQWIAAMMKQQPPSLSFHALVANNGYIFAGSYAEGIFRSSDNGAHWSSSQNGLDPTVYVYSLTVNGAALFAGTSTGIYRSLDNGEHWTTANNGLGYNSYATVAWTVTAHDGNIFAAVAYESSTYYFSGGVYRSQDNGDTWLPVNTGLTDAYGNTVYVNSFITSGGALFAGSETLTQSGLQGAGIYRTTDDGTNWSSYNIGIPDTAAVYDFSASGDALFAATNIGVFRSSNGGARWQSANSGLGVNTYIYPIAASGNVILAGTYYADYNGSLSYDGVYRSSDDGATWKSVSNGLPAYDEVLAFVKSGSTWFAGTYYYGVFRSDDDGASWNDANAGFANSVQLHGTVTGLAATNDAIFAVVDTNAYSSSVFRSADTGASFSTNGIGSLGYYYTMIGALANLNNELFAAAGTYAYTSTNDGATWVSGGYMYDSTGSYAAPYMFVASGKNIYAGTNMGIFRSTNNGSAWVQLNRDIGRSITLYSLASSGNYLFAGTEYGVYRSTDHGRSWTTSNNGLSYGLGNTPYVYALAASGGAIYAGGDNGGVFRSTDNGDNWTQINTGLPGMAAITAFAVTSNTVFTGTDSYGVFLLKNNSDNWIDANDGMPDTQVNALLVNNGYLLAGTNTAVWRRPLQEMITGVSGPQASLIPSNVRLAQNYPNPFGTTTTISYSLPNRCPVRLTVCNTLGEPVATLVNGEQNAGEYAIPFRSDRLPNGVYIYRLAAGGITQSGTMEVAK